MPPGGVEGLYTGIVSFSSYKFILKKKNSLQQYFPKGITPWKTDPTRFPWQLSLGIPKGGRRERKYL